ncbi:helix-turn-helix domain-containing protein [Microbacterium sp. 20-116]
MSLRESTVMLATFQVSGEAARVHLGNTRRVHIGASCCAEAAATLQPFNVRGMHCEAEDVSKWKRGFSRDQAADYCGVSVYKVAMAVRHNVLPARRLGKDVVVFREDLDRWMDGWQST